MFVNLIQVIAFLSAVTGLSASNYTWTLGITASQTTYQSSASIITASSTGKYIAAADSSSDRILVSADYGQSWSPTSIGKTCSLNTFPYFTGIASDASGQHMAVVSSTGGISFSQDYGVSWYCRDAPSPQKWSAVTSDATGKNVYATITGSSIYKSNNNGITWTVAMTSTAAWSSIASDSTGQYVVAVAHGGEVYYSSNYGATWTQSVESSAKNYWTQVTSDSTGKYLTAVSLTSNSLFVSNDYGHTWSLSLNNVASVASGSTGAKLAVLTTTNTIMVSNDRGSNWVDANAPKGLWHTITSNADGTRLVSQLYTNTSPYSNSYYIGTSTY